MKNCTLCGHFIDPTKDIPTMLKGKDDNWCGCTAHLSCGQEVGLKCSLHMKIEDNLHKIHLICRPTQLKKTFATILKIKRESDKMHIIFSKDTGIARDQFGNRLSDEKTILTYNIGSKLKNRPKKGTFKNAKTMIYEVENGHIECPDCVLMCTSITGKRMNDLKDMINMAFKINRRRVNIYFDESQENEAGTSRVREAWKNDDSVSEIVYITATPRKLLKSQPDGVFVENCPLDPEDLEYYRGTDSEIFEYRDLSDTHDGDIRFDEFVTKKLMPLHAMIPDGRDITFFRTLYYTLLDNRYILEEPKKYTFLPAKIKTSTHLITKEIVLELNKKAVVVILNGNGKTLDFWLYDDNTGRTISTEATGVSIYEHEDDAKITIDKLIAKRLVEHNLTERPVVITGNLCVGSSQTLISAEDEKNDPKLPPFDYAIFCPGIVSYRLEKDGSIKGSDRASQIIGRLTGIRRNEKRTIIFREPLFEAIVKNREKQAEYMTRQGGRMVRVTEYDNNGTMALQPKKRKVKMNVIRIPIGDEKMEDDELVMQKYKTDGTYEIRTIVKHSPEEGLAYMSDQTEEIFEERRNIQAKSTVADQYGTFFVMSKGIKNKVSTDVVHDYCRKYNTIRSNCKGNFYACYRDVNDPTTLEFWFVYGSHQEYN
jgi:hypothetical protein